MPTYIFRNDERMTNEELRERLSALLAADEHVSVGEFTLRGDEMPAPPGDAIAVTVDRAGYFEERVLPVLEASEIADLEWEIVGEPENR